VIADPSPLIDTLDADTLARVLARTDVFTANSREARLGSGHHNLSAAAQWYLDRIRPHGLVVVRDGHNGCWLAGGETGQQPQLVPAFKVTAVDTSGAGDAHAGVLAAALASGETRLQATQRANAAAAIAVTSAGPATAPTSDRIDALLRPTKQALQIG